MQGLKTLQIGEFQDDPFKCISSCLDYWANKFVGGSESKGFHGLIMCRRKPGFTLQKISPTPEKNFKYPSNPSQKPVNVHRAGLVQLNTSKVNLDCIELLLPEKLGLERTFINQKQEMKKFQFFKRFNKYVKNEHLLTEVSFGLENVGFPAGRVR